ncbi:hypothetical protein D9M71_325910 [compost metagenome]
MEQAGGLADHHAVQWVALAQRLGDGAFQNEEVVAVEERQVGDQAGALAELLQQRRGLLDQATAEALDRIAIQAPCAQPVAAVAQAAVDPALLLQGVQQARHRGLGQAGEVVQFLQAELLMLAEQLDDGQRPFH